MIRLTGTTADMSEAYRIPIEPCRTEETIKRSRFIATLAHAPSAEATHRFVARIRAEFPNAGHHCWACVAGPPGDSRAAGMSDDGEPRGTAGAPMLNTLRHAGVGEIAAVVTRYYGGIKLGTGGLVRAYSGLVSRALIELRTVVKRPLTELTVAVAYAHEDTLRRLLAAAGARILDQDYGVQVQYRIRIPTAQRTPFECRITAATAGKVKLAVPQP